MKKKIFALVALFAVALAFWLPRQAAGSDLKVLVHDQRKRTYRIHVPGNRSTRPALLLALHGGGGNSKSMERASRFSQIADREGFIVVYPDGIDKSWNDGRSGDFSTAHKEKVDDLGFLKALVEQVAITHDIDRQRVYATGISNGGFMSSRLAAEASEVFRAIAPVVAGIPKEWADSMALAHPVSVMVIQGTHDPIVPYAGGPIQLGRKKRGDMLSTEATVEKWRQLNGCKGVEESHPIADQDPKDGCTTTRIVYPGGLQGSVVELWRVDGGGHTWPGGDQYLPKKVIGPVCRDFDASQEIWKFFSRTTPRPLHPAD